MMDLTNNETILKAILCYGGNSQLGVVQEEAAELIQAVSKYIRTLTKSDDEILRSKMHVIEELADCEIMLAQLRKILEIEEWQVNLYKKAKLERMERRIKEEGQWNI